MKLKATGSGKWESEDGRWLVIREGTQRYELYDMKRRAKKDQLVGINRKSVADCEEMARGFEWSERQEASPKTRRKLKGHE